MAHLCQVEDDLEQHKEKLTQLLKQRVRGREPPPGAESDEPGLWSQVGRITAPISSSAGVTNTCGAVQLCETPQFKVHEDRFDVEDVMKPTGGSYQTTTDRSTE